jgi:uncharacterized protein (DUF1499 family)
MSIHFCTLITFLLMTMSMPSQARTQNTLQLDPCPNTPNCVSSGAAPSDTEHFIEPFALKANSSTAWPYIIEALKQHPRTKLTVVTNNLIKAEITSLVFRFVDDMTLLLHEKEQTIDVRSASRVGYSDLGVNRNRVTSLRKRLQQAGIIH